MLFVRLWNVDLIWWSMISWFTCRRRSCAVRPEMERGLRSLSHWPMNSLHPLLYACSFTTSSLGGNHRMQTHLKYGYSWRVYLSVLFILCCRILRILNMQQIGRHYYNPDDPFNIPQHRFWNKCVCMSVHTYLLLENDWTMECICLQADNLAWLCDHHPPVRVKHHAVHRREPQGSAQRDGPWLHVQSEAAVWRPALLWSLHEGACGPDHSDQVKWAHIYIYSVSQKSLIFTKAAFIWSEIH